MEHIERVQWAEACQMFYAAYAKFQIDGTDAHWYECNGRNIEIAFSGNSDSIMVQFYCPEVLRRLSGYFGILVENNVELISMLYWLIWEAEAPSVYSIETADSEQEYELLRATLTDRYRRCYYNYCVEEYWKGEGEERFIIALHGRQIRVCFYASDRWDVDGYIDVKLHCLETGEQFKTIVLQEENNPEEIIREIQRMAWED